MWATLVLLWVVCGLGSAWLADRKGRDPSNWFFAGAVAGPLGLIITASMPNRAAPTPGGGQPGFVSQR
jgi:hypothetical protein